MAEPVYHATGQVIDSETRKGIAALRVEAWIADVSAKRPLAVSETQEDGRFTLRLDFSNQLPETIPEVTFKVFRNEQLLEGIESAVLWNANAEQDVTILIKPPVTPTVELKDRITAKQFLKGADFIQQSDFVGLYQCFRDNVETKWSVVTDVVTNTFTRMDLKPVKPTRNIQKEIMNSDVEMVKRNLESEKVIVNEVLPYNPRLNRALLADITTLPTCLQPGQRVNLYEKNGTVKYYTVVKENRLQDTGSISVTGTSTEVKKLEKELKAAREESVRREKQLTQVQQELLTVRREQQELKKILQSRDFKKLLKSMKDTGDEENPVP